MSPIRPFYYDPACVTPLNIAVKDTDETVVDMIVKHDLSDPKDKKWLVRWLTKPPSETWENYENLKTVDAFHHYCATNKLDPFSPKLTPQFSVSVPNMSRRTATGQFTFPEPTVPTKQTTTFNSLVRRTRGRPRKDPLTEDA